MFEIKFTENGAIRIFKSNKIIELLKYVEENKIKNWEYKKCQSNN